MNDIPKEDKGDYQAPDVDSDEEEEGDEVPDMDTLMAQNKPKQNMRQSVSAEVYGKFNEKGSYTPKLLELVIYKNLLFIYKYY